MGASSHFSTADKHLESCNRFDFFIIFQQIVWFAVPLENNKHIPISLFGFSWNSSSEYFQMNLNVCILHEIFYSLFGLSPESRSGLSCKRPQDSRWADDEYYFFKELSIRRMWEDIRRAVHESDVLRFPRLMIICAEIPSPKIRFCERPDLTRGGGSGAGEVIGSHSSTTAFMFGSYLKSLCERPCVTRATNLTRQSLHVSVTCEKKKKVNLKKIIIFLSKFLFSFKNISS